MNIRIVQVLSTCCFSSGRVFTLRWSAYLVRIPRGPGLEISFSGQDRPESLSYLYDTGIKKEQSFAIHVL
jgi:DNA-directed RNA polymerase subunit N (RpoN/RPB10)